MKIAITQRQLTIRGITYDCLEQGWYNLFLRHEIIPIPNLSNIAIDVDMLVISGGETTEDRYQTEVACSAWAVENDVPIIGVCHGAFLLNYLHSGINVKGTTGHHNTEHEIRMEDKTYIVNSYHHMAIEELGINLEPIAHCDGVVEGFKHTERDIWGLVWHPERMLTPVLPTDLRELIYG
jgi:gamma-glutamyl-gamma-aminobutyrate hydrolase PuuD